MEVLEGDSQVGRRRAERPPFGVESTQVRDNGLGFGCGHI